jgi:hypothetical protein
LNLQALHGTAEYRTRNRRIPKCGIAALCL